jgi:2-keto-4-pentenoate hydratase/2-oxohepta-3-ene-1,7-dioic acid hydratase in catechol pathway
MRLAQVQTSTGSALAVEGDDGWRPLDLDHADLVALLQHGGGEVPAPAADAAPLVDPRLLAPLRPGKIVAIGLNYLDHVRESGVEPPPRPLVFAKFPSTVIGPEQEIVLNPAVAERVDWEGELAVIVGRPLTKATPEQALEAVFGYTIANDVSARDVQFADGQWIRGKNLDSFCPLGPVVVSADEVPDPQDLRLRTTVNGETVQDASTSLMIFKIAELLSFCSHSFTLEPGDAMLTGTPWGCGEFMDPRRSLAHGDVVEVSVSGIGSLRNPVVNPQHQEERWTP